ncbi:MAG TPA: hypothetical protein VGE13_04055 [Candidatus Saccharimonadales bacterium]
MSEQLQSPQYIDAKAPDYDRLAESLRIYLDNSPSAEDLAGLNGDSLVATVIWWAKEANQADPYTVVSEIFGTEVWEAGQWI